MHVHLSSTVSLRDFCQTPHLVPLLFGHRTSHPQQLFDGGWKGKMIAPKSSGQHVSRVTSSQDSPQQSRRTQKAEANITRLHSSSILQAPPMRSVPQKRTYVVVPLMRCHGLCLKTQSINVFLWTLIAAHFYPTGPSDDDVPLIFPPNKTSP
jgi:hypothetical protein